MILDPALLAAYVVLATALAVSPGPDVLFVVANGMTHKVRGAIASSLGIGAGSLLHALAAAVGISALIAASPLAYDILRYAGALYLFYLGLQAVRSWFTKSEAPETKPEKSEATLWQVFQRGLVTNILNPKVVVFYLALLPQFVNVDLGHVGFQVFLLGCIHNIIGVVFLVCVGSAAGKASDWLSHTSFGRWLDGLAGLFFIGLAVRIAISGKPEP